MFEDIMNMEISCKIPGKFVASICELNQWALDFEGNFNRIRESILISKHKGATYRLGPELEITGYNCQDHFNEIDTIIHGYEVLARLLVDKELHDIVIDVGLPVMHDGVRYNSRAICYNGDLIAIRPKTILANDGMYHEERWFVGWKKTVLGEWVVPEVLSKVIHKFYIPIGVFILQFNDVSIGIEMCEELFVPNSLHNLLSMNGAHVICNGNGSHFQVGKINKRFALVSNASGKTGCTYLYGNLQGCDGSTMYFDGGSFVGSGGKISSMIKRFSINSGIKVLTATIDINEIRSRRAAVVSLCKTSAESQILPKIYIHAYLCNEFSKEYEDVEMMDPYDVINKNNAEIEDLIGAPSCYLWDYLRRSGMNGFFIPLSGGADSSTVALIVYHMAFKLFEALQTKHQIERDKLLAILRRIVDEDEYIPSSPQEITSKILFTAYMGTENSSDDTKRRAKNLANFINSNHIEMDISPIFESIISTYKNSLDYTPNYKNRGGTHNEDLALQNIQARSRMVMSYFLSQLPNPKKKPNCRLLVLGTSNSDELATGYFTKYDCSSGDVSPIAGFGKDHINKIMVHFYEQYKQEIILEISNATPSAELRPVEVSEGCQSDEIELGFSFSEIKRMRELRSTLYCGPLSMFNHLLDDWGKLNKKHPDPSTMMEPDLIASKVKSFFTMYSKNRHKTASLPPGLHLSVSGLDGRHYDLRPFLYNVSWTWQFKCIDRWLFHRKNLVKKV